MNDCKISFVLINSLQTQKCFALDFFLIDSWYFSVLRQILITHNNNFLSVSHQVYFFKIQTDFLSAHNCPVRKKKTFEASGLFKKKIVFLKHYQN